MTPPKKTLDEQRDRLAEEYATNATDYNQDRGPRPKLRAAYCAGFDAALKAVAERESAERIALQQRMLSDEEYLKDMRSRQYRGIFTESE